MIRAREACNAGQKKQLDELMQQSSPSKVEQVLAIFKECGVDEWARSLKEAYMQKAFQHLEDTAVISKRKEPLKQLAEYLMQREH
jgi:geranylgeranyl diphosphate synthase, type II